ncbi:MAG: hypothetical protein O7E55_04635 [Chloroflexi bacterium]|nr:hypothetical protein [Chloroflexota bacterium]
MEERKEEMLTNASYLYVVRMDVAPDHEGEFNRNYDTEHIPTVLKAPGMIGAARFETSDTSVAKYVAIYEMEGTDVPFTKEFRALADSGEWPHRVRPYTSNHSRVVYKRIVSGT